MSQNLNTKKSLISMTQEFLTEKLFLKKNERTQSGLKKKEIKKNKKNLHLNKKNQSPLNRVFIFLSSFL